MSTVSDSTKTWRVLELINWTTGYLEEKGFDTPRTDIEWLLGSVLHCSRVQLYTDFEKPLTPDELQQFKAFLKRRLDHEPVQYIVGETEFMGLLFTVNSSVLIPRPETELLVENAVDWLRSRPKEGQRVLDIGTGSGCIAVSIAALVPGCQVTATDISPEALEVAEHNAGRNQVSERVRFLEQDILHQEPDEIPFDLIISNPPYIEQSELPNLDPDVKKYEPEQALVAGDGLQFFRRYARTAQSWLQNDGVVLLEIGGSHQIDPVSALFTEQGWHGVEVTHDYNDQGRILKARP